MDSLTDLSLDYRREILWNEFRLIETRLFRKRYLKINQKVHLFIFLFFFLIWIEKLIYFPKGTKQFYSPRFYLYLKKDNGMNNISILSIEFSK